MLTELAEVATHRLGQKALQIKPIAEGIQEAYG